jgi:hypothetical protein
MRSLYSRYREVKICVDKLGGSQVDAQQDEIFSQKTPDNRKRVAHTQEGDYFFHSSFAEVDFQTLSSHVSLKDQFLLRKMLFKRTSRPLPKRELFKSIKFTPFLSNKCN